MRVRLITTIVALIALFTLASSAQAAPKKAFVGFSSPAYSVTESNTTFYVTVQRTGNLSGTVTATVTDKGTGSATPANYSFTSPTVVTFGPGVTTRTVPVTIRDDTDFVANHTIVLGLSTVGGQLKTSTATITVLENDGPGTIDLSSSSYSVVESAGVATITVSRTGSATNLSESVDYTTTALPAGSGHATAGVDYMTTSGTLTFAAGEITKSFQVPILDDSIYEGPETLTVSLSNAKNLTNSMGAPNLGPNSPATLTIVDDDNVTFGFSQPTYSVTEPGPSGPTTATITVVRSGATNVPASVSYADAGTGTAATPARYTLTPGTLSFAAGDVSKTFQVTINDDGIQEGNQTVGLKLTDPVSGNQLATATLSIIDDDNPTGTSVQFSDVAYNTTEGGTATVTATLSKPVGSPVTVHYATADETQTATNNPATADVTGVPGDYAPASGTLTFAAGETTQTFTVQTHEDTDVEGDETLDVKLSSPSNAVLGDPSTAVVTITDDDLGGSLEFDNLVYHVNETDGTATVTVDRVGGASGATTVDYATSDGTAAAPGDYGATSGTLSFADGEASKSFTVPVVWDGRSEGTETVNLALSNPNGVSDLGSQSTAVLRIADDGASGPVEFSAGSYSVNEGAGTATVTVDRSGGSMGGPVTVDYATSDGSATAGSDYGATSGTLTFAAGQATQTFQVPVTDDATHEGDETVNLTLSNPGGGTTLGSLATSVLTITDDDAAPADTSTTTPSPVLQSSPADPNPAGSQTAPADNAAPKLALSAKKIQKALAAKRITLGARCSENCKLRVVVRVRRGHRTITLGRAFAKVAGGRVVKIRARLSKRARAQLVQALRHNRARVTLTVVAADAAGHRTTARRTITIKR